MHFAERQDGFVIVGGDALIDVEINVACNLLVELVADHRPLRRTPSRSVDALAQNVCQPSSVGAMMARASASTRAEAASTRGAHGDLTARPAIDMEESV